MKFPKLTKKQWLIGALVLLLSAGIGYWLYRRNQKRRQADQAPVPAPAEPAPADNVPLFSDCPNDSFPLRFGKCGKRVEQFQLYLIKTYGAQFSIHGVDGRWGEETEAIAKKFILRNEPYTISEEYFTKTGMAAFKTLRFP